jgi:hypothetical protein
MDALRELDAESGFETVMVMTPPGVDVTVQEEA